MLSQETPKPERHDEYAVELRDIVKRFGGVHALKGADLCVRHGEIMGLCGENGAGKSTLIKVLAGVHASDSYGGIVKVLGRTCQLTTPADARGAGVAVVHQELMLVPELSVAANLLLGREPRHMGLVDDEKLEALARAELARFGFGDQIDPSNPVSHLGIGLQQLVEILRALSQNARILVLDEPTAALTGQESYELLDWLRKLRSGGTSCIYVSHRIDEIFALCDRITVLQDGCNVATLQTAQTTPDEVVSLMVGRAVAVGRRRQTADRNCPPVLRLDNFGVHLPGSRRLDAAQRFAVQDISFSISPGECLAVCGAVGSGRTALLSSLFGCSLGGTTGSVIVAGRPVDIGSPAQAIELGLAFVPEDRRGGGLISSMSVAENLALPSLKSEEVMGPAARLGLVNADGEAELAERRIQELQIRGQAWAPVWTLSGGNQQKVVLGKWLERRPRVLLLDEPTRGVDVGAREEIYGILERLAADGIAILFASSDLSEVLRLAHRIFVLRKGRMVGELAAAEATEEKIVQLSTGARVGNAGPGAQTEGVDK